MALPADLFLQAWRPSAYVISGTINWISMFLVGMLFGYIVVRCLLCIVLSQMTQIHSICYLYVTSQSDFMCVLAGWTRPVLLPDFCGLQRIQRGIPDIFRPRDQRKDNGRDYGGLQHAELQEQVR